MTFWARLPRSPDHPISRPASKGSLRGKTSKSRPRASVPRHWDPRFVSDPGRWGKWRHPEVRSYCRETGGGRGGARGAVWGVSHIYPSKSFQGHMEIKTGRGVAYVNIYMSFLRFLKFCNPQRLVSSL